MPGKIRPQSLPITKDVLATPKAEVGAKATQKKTSGELGKSFDKIPFRSTNANALDDDGTLGVTKMNVPATPYLSATQSVASGKNGASWQEEAKAELQTIYGKAVHKNHINQWIAKWISPEIGDIFHYTPVLAKEDYPKGLTSKRVQTAMDIIDDVNGVGLTGKENLFRSSAILFAMQTAMSRYGL